MARRRTRVWSPKAAPAATVVILLGLWAAAVPLVGPYFDFGFLTSEAWTFSEAAVTLSINPGLAAALAGFLLIRPLRSAGGLGRLLLVLSAVWLLVGPSLYPIWSDEVLQPQADSDWKRALLWIGYFYGVGALLALLAGYVQGLVTRRQ